MKKTLISLLISILALHFFSATTHAQATPQRFERTDYSLVNTLREEAQRGELKELSNEKFDYTMYIVADGLTTFSQQLLRETIPTLHTLRPDVKFVFIPRTLNFYDREAAKKSILLMECTAQQQGFWVNLPFIMDHINSPAVPLQLQNIDQNIFNECVSTENNGRARVLYENSIMNGPEVITGLPASLLVKENDTQRQPIIIQGSAPLSTFQDALAVMDRELIVEDKNLLDNRSTLLNQCQNELAQLKKLTFLQRLKFLLTTK